MININPLLLTDSYKISHPAMQDMLTDGKLEYLYSNFTNRGSRVEGVNHVAFFGLQSFLKDLTDRFETFFQTPLDEVIEDYKLKTSTFTGPGFSVEHIKNLHNLGYLPIRFSAVPEGTLVPLRVPSMTFENTVSGFGWLVNYLETWLSTAIWHTSTSATMAHRYRLILDKAAEKTSSTPEAVDFQAHDFSFRGMQHWQSAAQSSAGHLLSFLGSDTLPVIDYVNTYYPGDNGLIAASVPASEHAVMCLRGQEDEDETYRRLIEGHPEGILSLVSDTWDLFRVITETLPSLKKEIIARNGKLVIRPDSGDPVDIICGTSRHASADDVTFDDIENRFPTFDDLSAAPTTYDELPQYIYGTRTNEEKGAIELLWEEFGGTINEKGYKELNPAISVIYGDSITLDRAQDTVDRLEKKGFASTNIVFGVGSYTYGGSTRDSFGSAVKATQAVVDGVEVSLQKNPKTDDGLKKSATGRLAVGHKANGELFLIQKATPEDEARSVIQPVWENGKFLKEYSYAEVRANVKRTTEILERNGGIS